jgi:hypothetical protein
MELEDSLFAAVLTRTHHMNEVQLLSSYFSAIHFNIIFPEHNSPAEHYSKRCVPELFPTMAGPLG